MVKDPKRILLDVQKELGGEFLEETFQVGDHSYVMRLMNDGEFSWAFSKVEATAIGNNAAVAIQIRKPILAMGIRAIDGVSITEIFKEEWDSLDDSAKDLWISTKFSLNEAKKFFSAELFLNFISGFSSTSISQLYDKWRELETRQESSRLEVKNSLGEGLEKVEKEISTEPSQSGEKRQIVLD